jgi:hypothetical protein
MQDYGVQLSKTAHKALMKKYGLKSEIGSKVRVLGGFEVFLLRKWVFFDGKWVFFD